MRLLYLSFFTLIGGSVTEWVKLPDIITTPTKHPDGLQNVTSKTFFRSSSISTSAPKVLTFDDVRVRGEVTLVTDEPEEEPPKNNLDFNAIVTLLKTIHKNVMGGLPHNLKDKSGYLKKLHDIIMINIEDRISHLWPSRQRRESKDGHDVDFLSAETALMTISFLTFAVYLIKLVMQVINILKAKKMMMVTPMVTTFARSAPEHKPRMAVDFETTSRILQLMEDFGRH